MRRMVWIFCLLWGVGIPLANAADLTVARAEAVEVPRIYQLNGVVEAVNASTISAQTSGQIQKVLFDVDDLVQAGEVILVIDDTEQRAALDKAQANLESAQARLRNTEKEYRRIRDVFAKKAVSKSVMDKASSDLQAARAAVDAAKAAVVQARQQLEYTQVRAPYTGIVINRLVEVGEIVSAGQQLMSGISLEQLRVNVDVPQSLVEVVRRDKEAAVRIRNELVKAVRVTIFPVADSTTSTFRVRLDLPAEIKGVYPGMYLKVALGVGKRTVLVVPASAVVYRSEVVGVYVVDDQNRLVHLRQIRIGNPLADGRFVVLSGLEQGEQVAIDPQAAVRKLITQRKERAGNE